MPILDFYIAEKLDKAKQYLSLFSIETIFIPTKKSLDSSLYSNSFLG